MNRPTKTYMPKALTRAQPPVKVPAAQPGRVSGIDEYASAFLNWPTTYVNPDVAVSTEANLLGIPAAWRAIHLISGAIATMMTSADVYSGADAKRKTPALIARPNNTYTSYEFWFELTATVLMHGNWVGIKADFDEAGFAQQVIPVHPANVSVGLTDEGYPLYKIGDDVYSYNDVIHIRGLTTPGEWKGLGVIEGLRKQVVGALNMQSFSNNTYSTASIPSAVIKTTLKPDAASAVIAADLKRMWIDAFGSGQRNPVVLSDGMDVAPLSWTPEDMQFLQAKGYGVAEIAFAFGLDPTDLGSSIASGSAITYANASERETQRLKYTYAPWLHRIEQHFSDALPDADYVRGNVEAILRGDTKSRYESYAVALDKGFMTIDEVRALERLAPLPQKEEPQILPQLPTEVTNAIPSE
jgi:HK97 family phage portal protein